VSSATIPAARLGAAIVEMRMDSMRRAILAVQRIPPPAEFASIHALAGA
jgi:hypothetical protein